MESNTKLGAYLSLFLTGNLKKKLSFYPDVDECANHTCANGASCVDGVNSYACSCVAGYTGDRCQTGKTILTDT